MIMIYATYYICMMNLILQAVLSEHRLVLERKAMQLEDALAREQAQFADVVRLEHEVDVLEARIEILDEDAQFVAAELREANGALRQIRRAVHRQEPQDLIVARVASIAAGHWNRQT